MWFPLNDLPQGEFYGAGIQMRTDRSIYERELFCRTKDQLVMVRRDKFNEDGTLASTGTLPKQPVLEVDMWEFAMRKADGKLGVYWRQYDEVMRVDVFREYKFIYSQRLKTT